jgi:erythromycin esterase-like protein
MMETLNALREHLGEDARIAVWAHNSHVGDASATEMGRHGQLNIGQLAKEQYGDQAFLVGFSTYTGTVTASSEWDEPAQLKAVNPGLPESYEALFHEVETPNFLLLLHEENEAAAVLRESRLQRAIGVMYLPETERFSHYFGASLPEQFDALIYFDETRALQPLETALWDTDDTNIG